MGHNLAISSLVNLSCVLISFMKFLKHPLILLDDKAFKALKISSLPHFVLRSRVHPLFCFFSRCLM